MNSTEPLVVDCSETPRSHEHTSLDTPQTRADEESASPAALSALVHETVALLQEGAIAEATKHPDFHKLTPVDASVSLSESEHESLREAESWLTSCPVQSRQWIIYEARLRPDISLSSFHDLLSTVLLSHGFQPDFDSDDASRPTGVYRRKVDASGAPSLFHLPTHNVVFARVGVSASKLRILRVYVCAVGGSVVPAQFLPSSPSVNVALHATADTIFAHLQSAIEEIGYALAILLSPSFCDGMDELAVALDDDYVRDVAAAFDAEMKATLRQLSLPLEEYAHANEVATAQLLSVLEPLYAKFHIDKPQPARPALNPSKSPATDAAGFETIAPSGDEARGLSRGERVTKLVHALWQTHRSRISSFVDLKIRDKRAQIARRVEYTTRLRRLALQSILDNAEAKKMLQATLGSAGDPSWEGAVLYEGSCILGKIPAKFYVTYDRLVFKMGMFMISSFKDIAFSSITRVTKPHVLGISVISIHHTLQEGCAEVQLTLVSDVDRVFELLNQVCRRAWEMHVS
ncbi:hypothetical protein, variant 1 [Aphanomyces invadans]|uniref:GRAM domain-containing protein n=1 Tax=Aphanomyces invadans TaxID=157072 RepID=A0A024U7Y5_9STRA|nr:hypothetical protein, variant 1 [Aphanomyces invadans]ETW01992.1 hypothetical protein, variant 1 [Aphanomyces invadans]|eukprot:XP_008869840.1 hypothetical protein, variant 1 [Aphanomyces invadans]